MEHTKGYCQCGCGEKTKIASRSAPRLGIQRGQPNKFLFGHGPTRSDRIDVYKNSLKGGIHVVIAERALGKPLPKNAVVHHINGVKGDNRRGNHVICEDQAYHVLLHVRARALKACSNPNWRKCTFCKRWDSPLAMKRPNTLRASYYHAACVAAYNLRQWRAKNPNREHRKETYARAHN